jgi:uncharacterized phage protein (TIGR02218 family)
MINPALIAWMVSAQRSAGFRIDLLTLKPRGLNPFQWASGAGRFLLPDGRVFVGDGPGIERDEITLQAGLQVSEMNISLLVDNTISMGGMSALQFAERGGLDGAEVTLEWAYFDTDRVFKGSFVRFSGMTGPAAWEAGRIDLLVRSLTSTLNVQVPRETAQPQCMWQVFDPGCGLNEAAWRVNGVVTGVGTGRAALMAFDTNLTQDDGWFDLGLLEFVGGAMNGVARTVKRYADGTVQLGLPLPVAPQVGQTFIVRPGCNRTEPTCRLKFNNRGRFKATPFVPPPETVA